MKKLLSGGLLALAATSFAWGQATDAALNNEPTFQQALKTIQYPALAEQPTKDAKVYVDFTIDKAGKISKVDFLALGAFSQAFVGEVTRLFADLPKQKAAYAGDYVLPVVFAAKPQAGVYQPTVSDRAAFNRTFVQLTHSKVLLNELYVALN